jgi:uncharacterized protein (DUF2141 family)
MQTVLTYLTLFFTGMMMTAQSSVTVTVTDLNSNDGKLMIGLYDSEKNFLSTRFMGAMETIENHTATFTFTDVPEGEYAISTFHDENDNQVFDMRFGVIPKEDYVTSNNAKGFFGPPDWDDAKFTVKDAPITIALKMND